MSISVKRAEGYVDFCEDLSLRAEWEEACDLLDVAKKRPGSDRLAGNITQLAANVREIEAAMEATIVRIKIRALGKTHWKRLGAEHPPRDDSDQDAAYGVDVSTFFDAVARESIFAAVEKVSGEVRDFDPKNEWDSLADEMTDGQYNEFVQKFLELNRGATSPGFSRAASLLTQSSEATSSSPSDSASPTSA